MAAGSGSLVGSTSLLLAAVLVQFSNLNGGLALSLAEEGLLVVGGRVFVGRVEVGVEGVRGAEGTFDAHAFLTVV